MQHFFSYFSEPQSVIIPDSNFVGSYGPLSLPNVDRDQVLKEAFEHPINSQKLSAIAREGDKVLIVVDDATEPTPVVFPFFHVIRELHQAGVSDGNITVLVANTAHRANTSAEIDRKIGTEMHQTYKVLQSSGIDHEMRAFGTARTELGTMGVSLLHLVHEASLVITISGIYPHRLLGFTGSGGILFPTLSNEQTGKALLLPSAEQPVENVLGRVESAARTSIGELLQFVPQYKFCVDVVLDRKLQIVGCTAGEPISAYHVSADKAKRISEVEPSEKADIVIVDSHPFDHTLFQAMRAVYSALPLLNPRGELIIVSPLLELLPAQLGGLGSHLQETRHHLAELAHRGALSHTPSVSAEIIAMAETFERVSIATFVSHGAGKSDATRFGFGLRSNVQDALNESLTRKGATARIILLTHGGLTAAKSA